jgi:hypothetical protein
MAMEPETLTSRKFIQRDPESPARLDMVPVMLNLDRTLLERINDMARQMGLNRSAFIVYSVSEKLRSLETVK